MGPIAVWPHLSEASLLTPGWKKNYHEEAEPQAKHCHTVKVKRGSGEKRILKGHLESKAVPASPSPLPLCHLAPGGSGRQDGGRGQS